MQIKMGDARVNQYWCYLCSQAVNPIMEPEIKCPFCESGFVEEIDSPRDTNNNGMDLRSENALSLWAPVLLGLMGGLGPAQLDLTNQEHNHNNNSHQEENEQENDSESNLLRRRRNRLTSILRTLQDIRSGTHSQPENDENDTERGGSMILVNPFNEEALIIQGSFDMNQAQNPSQNAALSFGDYVLGPGLDLLLQHLLDNDHNRHGSPPAKKEAVQAMPNVTVEESMQCSVCLEDLEVGTEAKEMPCKHKFHGGCILPWLELHNSCPVCRFQLPSDDSKTETSESRNIAEGAVSTDPERSNSRGAVGDRRGNGRNFWIPVPWPFDGLFSVSGSQNGGSSASAVSSAPMLEDAAYRDEN